MATIVPQRIIFPPGLVLTTATYLVTCAAGGDVVNPNNGSTTFVVVRNSHATLSRTVTLDDSVSIAPIGAVTFNPDVQIVIAALTECWFGILPTTRFTTAVALTYSDAAADLKIGAFYI